MQEFEGNPQQKLKLPVVRSQTDAIVRLSLNCVKLHKFSVDPCIRYGTQSNTS